MINIILTVLIQTVVIVVIGIFAYRKLKLDLSDTIDGVLDMFSGIFEKPLVKQSMSVLGKKSAESRAEKRVVDDVATQILDSPQIAGYKMMAKEALGVDIDGMVEEYGAPQTLMGIQQILGMLGIDLTSALSGGLGKGLNITTGSGNTINPYMKRGE